MVVSGGNADDDLITRLICLVMSQGDSHLNQLLMNMKYSRVHRSRSKFQSLPDSRGNEVQVKEKKLAHKHLDLIVSDFSTSDLICS